MSDFDLFSGLVPSARFGRIILRNTGTNPNYETNPHIDSEREPWMVKNEQTGKVEWQKVLPNMTAAQKSGENLCVDLIITLAERVDSDGISSTWFNNTEMTEYANIKLLQLTDKKAFEDFVKGKLAFMELENKVKKSQQSVLNLKSELAGKTLGNYDYVLEDDGAKLYEIQILKSFSLTSSPDFLAYVLIPYFDLKQMAQKLDLDLQLFQSSNMRLYGSAEIDVVLEEGQIISEAYSYYKNGAPYVGEVSKENVSTDGSPLEVKKSINTKIQDFRSTRELEKIDFDFSTVLDKSYDYFINHVKVGGTQNSLMVPHENSLFSEVWLSRDKDGNCRFLFAFDVYETIRRNTVFGSLFKSEQELLENVVIRSMVINRYRVSNMGKDVELKNARGFNEFNSDDSFHTVVVSGEKERGLFLTKNTDNGSLRELELAAGKSTGVRYFTGIDRTVSKLTFGLYVYEVVVELEDRTAFYFEQRLDDLIYADYLLEQYYNSLQIRGNYNYTTHRLSNSYLQSLMNAYKDSKEAPWFVVPAAYLELFASIAKEVDINYYSDVLYGLLHPSFVSMDSIMLVKELLRKFSKKIESILGSSSSYKKRSWIPSQKTTSRWKPGQEAVLKSSITFSTKSSLKTFKVSKVSENYFDSDIPKKVGYDLLESEEVKSANNIDGLLVISRLAFEKRTGQETLKYFASPDENVNIAASGKQYTNDDNMSNMKYAYITPAKMCLGPNITNDMSKSLSTPPSQIQSMVADVSKFKFSKNSPQLPMMVFQASSTSKLSYGEQNSKATGEFIAEQKGMTFAGITDSFVSKFVSETKAPAEKKLKGAEQTSVKSLLGVTTKIENEKQVELLKPKKGSGVDVANVNNNNLLGAVLADYQKSGIKTSLQTSPKMQEAKLAAIKTDTGLAGLALFAEPFNLGNESNALNKTNMKAADIKELPNQLKSVFIGSISPEKVSFVWDTTKDSSSDKNKFDLNYNLIYQIDILDGYEYNNNKNGGSFLKSPIWKKLTEDVYNKHVGTNVLCRASTYTNKEMNIENPKGFDLGVFNQYFILSPEEKIVDLTKTTKSTPVFNKIVEKLFKEGPKEPLGLVATTTFDKATKQPGLGLAKPSITIANVVLPEVKPSFTVANVVLPEVKPAAGLVIAPQMAVVFGGVKK